VPEATFNWLRTLTPAEWGNKKGEGRRPRNPLNVGRRTAHSPSSSSLAKREAEATPLQAVTVGKEVPLNQGKICETSGPVTVARQDCYCLPICGSHTSKAPGKTEDTFPWPSCISKHPDRVLKKQQRGEEGCRNLTSLIILNINQPAKVKG